MKLESMKIRIPSQQLLLQVKGTQERKLPSIKYTNKNLYIAF